MRKEFLTSMKLSTIICKKEKRLKIEFSFKKIAITYFKDIISSKLPPNSHNDVYINNYYTYTENFHYLLMNIEILVLFTWLFLNSKEQ